MCFLNGQTINFIQSNIFLDKPVKQQSVIVLYRPKESFTLISTGSNIYARTSHK